MILLDTNVVSALMQRAPDAAVVSWLDDQPAESVWTTAITVFEVRTGLGLLEAGKRRRELEQAFDQLLEEELEGRVQAFDQRAAVAAGAIAASRTRNIRHFEGLEVSVVNPWSV